MTSRSPNTVSARVRGMGVALIINKSGRSPFAMIAARWVTPKRCCSSTTTRRSERYSTSRENRACVPTTMSIDPSDRARRRRERPEAFTLPVRKASRMPSGSSTTAAFSACWRARSSVGAITAACPPSSTARRQAMKATRVFPEPTSPCSRRAIGKPSSMSAFICVIAAFWSPVRSKGSRSASRACLGLSAGAAPRGAAPREAASSGAASAPASVLRAVLRAMACFPTMVSR